MLQYKITNRTKIETMLRKIFFITISFMLSHSILAQHSQVFTHSDKHFHDAKELYNQRKWAASYRSFETYLNSASPSEAGMIQEASYYLASNAYELRQENAERLLMEYLGLHPYSPYIDRIYMMLGMLFYEKRDYQEALNYFKLVDETHLINREKSDYLYSRAYAHLERNEIDKALNIFNGLKRQNSAHQATARYYAGYCEYLLGNYEEALSDFLVIENNPKFNNVAPYYIAQIYYAKRDYFEMEKRAEQLIKREPNNINNAELYRMIGEKAYNDGNYLKAIDNLKKYEELFPRVLRNDIYYLGVSYLKAGIPEEAVKYLSQATNENDEMSESAYLMLGNAYVKLNDKDNARMAYEAAIQTKYNAAVREEALYNYALTSYETTTSFGESVKAFEQFINEFPNSKQIHQAYDYLTTVYLTSNNYAEAYRSINQISNLTPKLKETKQYLEYQLGTEAFLSGNYPLAIENFNRSIQTLPNGKYIYDNYYWIGESQYRLRNYEQAVNSFSLFMKNPSSRSNVNYTQALYSMAYSYFNQRKYNDSQTWFLRYINEEKNHQSNTFADTHNRLGDLFFNSRDFSKAEEYYQKALNYKYNADYALFQSAYISGLNKNYNQKIDKLNQLLLNYPNSEFGDDALYEMGRAYLMMNNNTHAVNSYKRLIDNYPNSNLAPKSQLEIAMVYTDQNLLNNAINMYKKVIEDFPASEEAKTALESLENIYIDTNNVDEYLKYAQSLGKTMQNQSTQRADSIQFIAAEKQYLNKNLNDAIKGLENYLSTYCPGGKYCTLAQYYLADSYYITNNKTKALQLYSEMLKIRGNPYAEDAALRSAEISFDQKEYQKSLQYFKQLEVLAQKTENRNIARIGILRTSYFLNNKNETIAIAEAIIADNNLDKEIKAEAYLNRAKVYSDQNLLSAALKDLKAMYIDTRTSIGAEAKFLLADVNFRMNNLNDAEKEVLNFANLGTPHQYWLARAFIVLADVYIQKGDDFQAKQYLMSLQNNYTTNDDVQTKIESRLNQINQRSGERVIN